MTLKSSALEKSPFNFVLFLLVLQVCVCTVSSEPHLRKLLARSLMTRPPRCMAEVPQNQKIAHYSEKVLEINPFNLKTTGQMTIDCYYNQSCFLQEMIGIEGFDFEPAIFNFTAEKLPQVWKGLGTAKVLFLDNLDKVFNGVQIIIQNLEAVFNEILQSRVELYAEINQFLKEFNSSVNNLSTQVVQEIIVQLNSTNSDLALQFEQILVNAFSILIGKYQQQVINDYLYFSNKLQNIVQVVQNEVQTKEGELSSANQTVVFADIDLVSSDFANVSQQFIAEFNKYQVVRDNYTEIIDELLRTQLVEKFNFSNYNLTVAVRDFLITIIQLKRNLVNETRDQFNATFTKYQQNLNDTVANQSQALNTSLEGLKAYLQSNASNQSQTVESLFTNQSLISELFAWNYSIDALGSLNQTAYLVFADALNQFEVLFVVFVSNIAQVIGQVNQTFNDSFWKIQSLVLNLTLKIQQDASLMISEMQNAIYQIAQFLHGSVENAANTEYNLTEDEQVRLQNFNLFSYNVSVTSVLLKFLDIKRAINGLIGNLTSNLNISSQLVINTTGLNTTIVNAEIIANITALVNQTSMEILLEKILLNANFTQFEAQLGITNQTNQSSSANQSSAANQSSSANQSNQTSSNQTSPGNQTNQTNQTNLGNMANQTIQANQTNQTNLTNQSNQTSQNNQSNQTLQIINATQFLVDIEAYLQSKVIVVVEIFNAILTNNFTNITSLNESQIAGLESRFGEIAIGMQNFTGLPFNHSQNIEVVLTNFSLHGLINFMSVKLGLFSSLNGTYGSFNQNSISGFIFELNPEVVFSVELEERKKDFSLLQFNASLTVNGSGNISNDLVLGLITTDGEILFEGNYITAQLSDFMGEIKTSQQFINITTVQECSNSTLVCQNVTTYGWDKPIVYEKNATLPAQQLNSTSARSVNITEFLQ